MKVRLDPHTLERAEERGASEEEIRDTLETSFPVQAKRERLGRAKIYPFNRVRHGTWYTHKQVEVIYTIKEDQVITVTVYVFYGTWEEQA